MPAQPAWFHRLADIREELCALEVSHLDRLAVEKLFSVRERRARQLMAGLPDIQVGNAFAVERQALLTRLDAIASGDRFQREASRRARIVNELDRTRRHLAARRVVLAASPASRRLLHLAETIELGPGALRISFRTAEELAGRLFELSQAMAGDWEGFTAAVTPGNPPGHLE
jgi:hypothetical protein